MIVICKNCGNDIILSADNIGLKINYYGECNKCGTHYDVDYDARTKDKTRENWWMPTNKDKNKKVTVPGKARIAVPATYASTDLLNEAVGFKPEASIVGSF